MAEVEHPRLRAGRARAGVRARARARARVRFSELVK